jgi:hypothetical protein
MLIDHVFRFYDASLSHKKAKEETVKENNKKYYSMFKKSNLKAQCLILRFSL